MLLRSSSSKFFKIDVCHQRIFTQMERKLLPALRKMKDDIHVVGNISDGFDEKAMKYFPKKQKELHVQSLNELKSLSHNPNVPEDCSDDFEIHLVKMVEFLYINMSGFFPKLTVL